MERSQQVHELLCRTRDSVRVIRGISAQENVCFASPGFVCQFSRCGTKLALVDLNGLKVLRTSDYTEIMFSRRANVQLLHFSNCGRYLVSWEKPQEENPNLILLGHPNFYSPLPVLPEAVHEGAVAYSSFQQRQYPLLH